MSEGLALVYDVHNILNSSLVFLLFSADKCIIMGLSATHSETFSIPSSE